VNEVFTNLIESLKRQGKAFEQALRGKSRGKWDKLQDEDGGDALALDTYAKQLTDDILNNTALYNELHTSLTVTKIDPATSPGSVQSVRAQLQDNYLTSTKHAFELRYKTRLQMMADAMSRRLAQDGGLLHASAVQTVEPLYNINGTKTSTSVTSKDGKSLGTDSGVKNAVSSADAYWLKARLHEVH
jgi:hypothetical protein